MGHGLRTLQTAKKPCTLLGRFVVCSDISAIIPRLFRVCVRIKSTSNCINTIRNQGSHCGKKKQIYGIQQCGVRFKLKVSV